MALLARIEALQAMANGRFGGTQPLLAFGLRGACAHMNG